MNDKLAELYENMGRPVEKTEIIQEKGPMQKGGELEGAEKAKAPKLEVNSDNKVDAPVKGPSQGDDAVAKGKGTDLKQKVDMHESEEVKFSFDELCKKTLTEEFGEEEDEGIQPAADIESPTFDDETGDFGGEGDESLAEEEVDVATELRLICDRLSDIADKLSGESEEGMEGLEGEEEEGMEGLEGAEETPVEGGFGESHTPHLLKKASKSKFNPKMKMTASNISKQGGKAKVSTTGKDVSGKLSSASKSKLTPKTPLAVQGGSGPAVKGGGAKLFG